MVKLPGAGRAMSAVPRATTKVSSLAAGATAGLLRSGACAAASTVALAASTASVAASSVASAAGSP
ncbi:MAG: hypothetical protein ACRDPK_08365, partial [Carbonactinosporaceae bacterium]